MEEFLTALAYDVEGEYEQAVAAYERAILWPQAPVEAFANLSFIYWESATHQPMPLAAGTVVPLPLATTPWQMSFRVLSAGLERYPKDLELSFWARYYPYRGVFDEFSAADCQQLLIDCVDHNQTLMPYFFLSLFDEELYSAKVAQIMNACERSPTAKNLWIASVLGARSY